MITAETQRAQKSEPEKKQPPRNSQDMLKSAAA